MNTLPQPTVLIGCSSLAGWFARERVGTAVVLVDAALADTAVVGAVRDAAADAGCVTTVDALTGPTSLFRLGALASQVADTGAIVGIGGGSVLDQAKLVRALCGSPSAAPRLRQRQRAGWVSIPGSAAGTTRLVAVPTTVGTGAELSSVACLDDDRGKRLVEGACLLPDVAVLDPAATRTLPVRLLLEGVFEALSRTIGPYAGSRDGSPFEDGLAETTAACLAALGHRVRACEAAGQPVDDRVRLEIARSSGFSHSYWMILEREPFAYKAWFLAAELSHAAGCRKVPALAGLLPPLWRRILDGETALGSASRLRRIWQRVADAGGVEPLPGDPVAGVAALARRWGIEPPAGFDRGAVVRGALRRWGAGLPMLAGVSPALLTDIVDDSILGERGGPSPRRPEQDALAAAGSAGGVGNNGSSYRREGT